MFVCFIATRKISDYISVDDFIKDDFIQEGDGQVASGSASLPDPVAWRQRNRGSKESRMSMMFLKHWVTTSVRDNFETGETGSLNVFHHCVTCKTRALATVSY